MRDAVCGRSLIGIYDLHSTNLLVSRSAQERAAWLGREHTVLTCALSLSGWPSLPSGVTRLYTPPYSLAKGSVHSGGAVVVLAES